MENQKKYVCIYVMPGMLKNNVQADTIKELYSILASKEIVEDVNEEMSDDKLVKKIYQDGYKTTGRIVVYKINEEFDIDDDESDEYVIVR